MQALLDLLNESSFWQEAEAEGEARGKAEGELMGRLTAQHEVPRGNHREAEVNKRKGARTKRDKRKAAGKDAFRYTDACGLPRRNHCQAEVGSEAAPGVSMRRSADGFLLVS